MSSRQALPAVHGEKSGFQIDLLRDTVSMQRHEKPGLALYVQAVRTYDRRATLVKLSYERLREIHERLRAFARKNFQATDQRLSTRA